MASKISSMFHGTNGHNASLYDLWEANDAAAAAYRPKPYPGRITVFKPFKEYARYRGAEMGWDQLALGGVDTHVLQVYPAGMLVEPFVDLLATELSASIDRALELKAASPKSESAAAVTVAMGGK